MRHIAISGELGSGKSVVAAALAEALGTEVCSTGAIHRAIAADRGMSALETNLVAESDEEIDARIDGELVRRAQQEDQLVFDSRLAWHFVPTAFAVHLVVDPTVGASRMLGRLPTDVEQYESVEEAAARAEERHASEQRRFLGKYGVDIDRLRNYDLVVDTSQAPVEDIAAWVRAAYRAAADAPTADAPSLAVSPRRLLPTAAADVLDGADVDAVARQLADDPHGAPAPELGYSRPWFCVVAGHEVVSAALRAGRPLMRAALRAEDGEPLVDDASAADYVATRLQAAHLAAWQDRHDFRFTAVPARLAPS